MTEITLVHFEEDHENDLKFQVSSFKFQRLDEKSRFGNTFCRAAKND